MDDAGLTRKAPKAAPPKDLTPAEPTAETETAELGGERVEVELWLPSKVQKQIDEMSEWCERGATWVFVKAYGCSRSKVLGAEPGPPPKKTRTKRAPKKIAVTAMPGPSGQPGDDDEALFKPPSAWEKVIDLRRGGWFARTDSKKPNPERAFQSMANAWSPCPPGVRIGWDPNNGKGADSFTAAPFDPVLTEVVQYARSRLEGEFVEPDSPEVEAVTACLLRPAFEGKKDSPIIPYWLGAAGHAFAVECVLASVRLASNHSSFKAVIERYTAGEPRGPAVKRFGPGLPLARALRRSLATANAAEYEAARARCAELREALDDLGVRVAAAYLFPTERAWFDEAAAEIQTLRSQHIDFAFWLYASYCDSPYQPENAIGEGYPFLPAMVEGFGRELPRTIVREVRYLEAMRAPNRTTKLKRLGEALAAIPTDEAMTALREYARHKTLGPYLNLAAQSYPKRAARLVLVS